MRKVALAQYPAGWLSDRFDRRHVLIGLSMAAVVSCGVTAFSHGLPTGGVMATAFFFGLTTFPIYSVSAAHAHDFADNSQRVELSAALMFWYAIGAIAAPLVASKLMQAFGPYSMFVMIAVGHVALVFFGLRRMGARPTRPERTRYIWTPRTSFQIGRLTRHNRDEK